MLPSTQLILSVDLEAKLYLQKSDKMDSFLEHSSVKANFLKHIFLPYHIPIQSVSVLLYVQSGKKILHHFLSIYLSIYTTVKLALARYIYAL